MKENKKSINEMFDDLKVTENALRNEIEALRKQIDTKWAELDRLRSDSKGINVTKRKIECESIMGLVGKPVMVTINDPMADKLSIYPHNEPDEIVIGYINKVSWTDENLSLNLCGYVIRNGMFERSEYNKYVSFVDSFSELGLHEISEEEMEGMIAESMKKRAEHIKEIGKSRNIENMTKHEDSYGGEIRFHTDSGMEEGECCADTEPMRIRPILNRHH